MATGHGVQSGEKGYTELFNARRGVKRGVETEEDRLLLLLSPDVGSSGLGKADARELAEMMMQLALSQAGKPSFSTSSRVPLVTLEAVSSATAVARSRVEVSSAGAVSANCALCSRFFYEPVTAACGHTFCLSCLSSSSRSEQVKDDKKIACGVLGCGEVIDSNELHVNNALADLLRKWFPEQADCMSQWRKGEELLKQDKCEAAVDSLSSAISRDAQNWEIRCCRSRAFSQLGRLQESLADAKKYCQLCPSHSELVDAHLYRAGLEYRLGTVYESATSVLHSVILKGSSWQDASDLLSSILVKLSMDMVRERRTAAIDGELGRRLQPLIQQAVSAVGKKSCVLSSSLFANLKAVEPSVNDMDCPLCCRLLYQPVTTRCGHMFCRSCLDRALDHRLSCPCCRHDLEQPGFDQVQPVTEIAEKILKLFLSEDYTKREEEYKEEIQLLRGVNTQTCKLPIFVCTLCFPTTPCPLRVHEPRYRLMLRRCLQSGTRQFGMCLPQQEQSSQDQIYVNYGTLLQIGNVSTEKDGSFNVAAFGSRRFKVLDRDLQDGYSVSVVEWIDDDVLTDDAEKEELKKHHDAVYDLAKLFLGQPSLQQILLPYGVLPGKPADPQENSSYGPDWLWYCLNLLPLNAEKKIVALSSTSLRQRLEMVQACLNAYRDPRSNYAFMMYLYMRR